MSSTDSGYDWTLPSETEQEESGYQLYQAHLRQMLFMLLEDYN